MAIFRSRQRGFDSNRDGTAQRKPRRVPFYLKLRFEPLEDRRLLSTIYSTTLDTNPGWTTSGQWVFGHPTGGGGVSHPNPDPSDGYTGSNVYGVNLSGDYSTSAGGPYYLATKAIDCTNFKDVTLAFRRWLNTDHQPFVVATIEVSNNGTTWNTIYANPTDVPVTDNSWQFVSYDIGAYATNRATVFLRWDHKVSQSTAYAYSGWNIDDITVSGTQISATQVHTWDGGSPLNNLWTTPDNWVGDAAPLAGDDLVFPAGASRSESVNNYPSGTQFKSITVSGSGYLFHNGISSSTSVQVPSGTLTVESIVADTLTIGISSAGAVDSIQSNARSAAVVEQPFTNPVNVASVFAFSAASMPFAAKSPQIIPAVQPIDNQTVSTLNNKLVARSPEHTEQENSDPLFAQLLLEKPFSWSFNADLYKATRLDSQCVPSFSQPSLDRRTDRLKDSVYDELTDSLSKAKKQSSATLTESQHAHRLALQSIVTEFQHSLAADQEDFEPLIGRHFRKQDELAKKTVDDFHAGFVAAMGRY